MEHIVTKQSQSLAGALGPCQARCECGWGTFAFDGVSLDSKVATHRLEAACEALAASINRTAQL